MVGMLHQPLCRNGALTRMSHWIKEPRMSQPSLEDLDRCIHGRHAIDPCLGCPDGQSTGNLFLTPGTRIGTTLYGKPILAPERN